MGFDVALEGEPATSEPLITQLFLLCRFRARARKRLLGRLVFEPASPAVGLLDHLPGWERVYVDAIVHRK